MTKDYVLNLEDRRANYQIGSTGKRREDSVHEGRGELVSEID